ncbi:hypothetical protein FE257_001675 [Aspergillus nanangensis]|uniref:Uncharacterized protein n=1 Tax=Aspergillus nanangensis TaxID=2582783 RepID=A0AAD4CU30_ASPNN|nr:hypothetical protein FE257_001675 [Aspergillus nanangensis]
MAYYDDRQYYQPPRDRASRPSNHDYYYPSSASPANPYPMDVVHRHDGSNNSVEEIPRDYPPGEYGYDYGPPNPRRSRVATAQEGVRRSHSTGGRPPYYDDADYHHRSSRGRKPRHYDDRHGGGNRHSKYSRSPSSSSRSPPPRHRRRRKSVSEQALGALGLGSASARSRSRGRNHRSYSYSPSPTRGNRGGHRRDKSEARIAQAVKAAVTAGAVEAFRLRKDPGDWKGEKGKRILTAALTAGGTDGLVDRDPSKHSKRHLVESTLAGLAANHFVNGPRSRSRSKPGRGRNRSKSRSGVGNIAVKGALAAAGKEAWDRYQSRSRSRHRGRGSDRGDDGSLAYGEGSPRRSKRRSRSVSGYISRGLEALGLDSSNSTKEKDDRDHNYHHRRSRHGGASGVRSSRYDSPTATDNDRYSYYSDDDWDNSPRRSYTGSGGGGGGGGSRRARHSRDVGRPITRYSANHPTIPPSSNAIINNFNHNQSKHTDNTDSDLGNSTDEEHHHKKLTRQTLVATGLATVATIHAAHGLHESMEKHKHHVQLVKDGEMTPEEARRQRLKGNLSDAASVGLAALGVKGVVGHWKDADAKRKSRAAFARERSVRHGRRERDYQIQQRRRARSHSHAGRARTMYPDEIEENFPERLRGRRESLF